MANRAMNIVHFLSAIQIGWRDGERISLGLTEIAVHFFQTEIEVVVQLQMTLCHRAFNQRPGRAAVAEKVGRLQRLVLGLIVHRLANREKRAATGCKQQARAEYQMKRSEGHVAFPFRHR